MASHIWQATRVVDELNNRVIQLGIAVRGGYHRIVRTESLRSEDSGVRIPKSL